VRRPTRSAFPLTDPACRLYARARQGVHHGVLALGLRPGDEVLAPAYHHGSEVEALRRAGLTVRFHDVGPDLGPDPDEVARAVGPATRALYLIHTFGFPQDAPAWRAWCDDRDLLLIEDVAMGWPGSLRGQPLGSWGDLAVFCLYKTFGLPDGAAAVSGRTLPTPGGRRPFGGLGMARRQGAWLAQRWGWLGALRERAPARPEAPYADQVLGDPDRPMSVLARLAIRRLDPSRAVLRLGHHRRLAGLLQDLVPTAVADPPDGTVPFVCPVAAPDPRAKDALLAGLRRRGIDALDLWREPHPAVEPERFPVAARLRSRMVGLPVHQELPADAPGRIAEAVRASLSVVGVSA